jgi:hypothetical protein
MARCALKALLDNGGLERLEYFTVSLRRDVFHDSEHIGAVYHLRVVSAVDRSQCISEEMVGRNMEHVAHCEGDGWDDMIKKRTGFKRPDAEVEREMKKRRREIKTRQRGRERVVKSLGEGQEVKRVVEFVRT